MDVRSENSSVHVVRWAKIPGQVIQRTRLQVWFIRVCSSILIWTCLVQIVTVGELWHPKIFSGFSNPINGSTRMSSDATNIITPPPPPPLPPTSELAIVLVKLFLLLSCLYAYTDILFNQLSALDFMSYCMQYGEVCYLDLG